MAAIPSDAAEALQAIFSAPNLGARIATAIVYLETRWENLPNDLKRNGGQASRIRADFVRREGETPQSFDLAEMLITHWLGRSHEATDALILAFLFIVDTLLYAIPGRSVNYLLAHEHLFDDGTVVYVWIAPHGLLRLLEMDEDRTRVNLNDRYERTVDGHLSAIRHVIKERRDRAFDVDEVEPEVVAHMETLWRDGAFAGPLRVGLHPLRGPFGPELLFTKKDDSRPDDPCFLFRAGDVTPLAEYKDRIRAAVKAAADRDVGVQFLIFPEFLMTNDGLEALQDAIEEELERSEDAALPLMIFAGTSHVEHSPCNRFGNCCAVFDATGRPLWQQWKRIPFGYERHDTELRHAIKNLPPDATGDIWVAEDIEAHGPYVIRRTPLGAFAIAICSDMVVWMRNSPAHVWSGAPIDWMIIPSFTPSTHRFVEAAGKFIATRAVVLFVNGFPASYTARTTEKMKDPWAETPREFSPTGEEPVFAAFVSTAWKPPVAMVIGDGVEAVGRQEYWIFEGGLTVDLVRYLQIHRTVVDA